MQETPNLPAPAPAPAPVWVLTGIGSTRKWVQTGSGLKPEVRLKEITQKCNKQPIYLLQLHSPRPDHVYLFSCFWSQRYLEYYQVLAIHMRRALDFGHFLRILASPKKE